MNNECELIDEAIRNSEEQCRDIIKTAMDGFCVTDAQGCLLEVNDAYCRMSGFSEQELLTMRIADLDANEKEGEVVAHIQKILAQGADRFQTRHRRKDGSIYDVEVSAQDRTSDYGQLIAFLRDITEFKRTEKALYESEAKLKEAQRVAQIGNWEWNATANTTFWSEELCRVLNVDTNMPLPNYEEHLKLYTTESIERLDAAVKKAMEEGEPYALDLELANPNATRKWIVARGEVLRNAEGTIMGLRGTAQNITERKRHEEEKAKLEAQLQQSRKLESVGRLAGGVAHDFNNILSVILGQAELALKNLDSTHPLYVRLEEIRKAAVRSADLTRQLLAFARKQPIAPKVMDLNMTVAGMFNMLQRLIGENIHLKCQPAEDLWPVRMDPTQVDQILTNLCANSRDSIANVGTITIEMRNSIIDENYCANHAGCSPGEYVRLAISDDGCGMDKGTLANIFEPFFTTKEMGKGTGLGLAMVYGIVKQNNGFITAYSEPGLGTTFTIYLPRHFGKVAQASTEGTEQPAPNGHETILLVEDEPAILEVTTSMLTSMGYTVLPANTPGEAIRLAREYAGEIHLLITDVVMPEMNGRDLAKNLLSLYPQVKRLFMSGYTTDVIALHGVLDEGVHFIQKPFSMQNFAKKVREVLDY